MQVVAFNCKLPALSLNFPPFTSALSTEPLALVSCASQNCSCLADTEILHGEYVSLPCNFDASNGIQLHRMSKGLINSPSGSLGGRVQQEVQHTKSLPWDKSTSVLWKALNELRKDCALSMT